MNRRSIIAVCAGLAGLMALIMSSGRAPALPSAGFRMDRDAAVQRAREISRNFGVDTQVWHSGAMSSQDKRLQVWLHARAASPLDRLATPLTTKVGLAALSGDERITVTFNADGTLLSYRRTGAAPQKTPPQDSKAIAVKAFGVLTRAQFAAFRLVTDGAPAPGETQYVWEAESSRPDELTWSVKVAVGSEGLREASLTPNLSRRAANRLGRGKPVQDAFDGIAAISALVLVLVAGGIFIYAWFRGTAERGAAIGAGLLVFFTGVLSNLVGSGSQRYLINDDAARFSALTMVLEIVLLSLAGMVLVGGGETVARQRDGERWFSLLLLLRGGLSAQRVGIAVCRGLLFGLPLTAFAYLVALLPEADLEWTQPALQALSSPTPWLEALTPPVGTRWLVLFCVLVPVLEQWLPRFPGKLLLVGVAVILGLFSFAPFSPGIAGAALWAVFFGGACYAVYRGYDLLTLLAAISGYTLFSQSWALLVTDSPALQSSAHFTLLLAAAGWGGAAFIAWRGRQVKLELTAVNLEPVSHREKLKSEFSTARHAQMRMLPTDPPRIPGFELAGVCHPAREVGGDLYDYPRLADGRHVICVADVSGKGMSAALYMTLTKGVLTAAVEGSDDLGEIAGQLNAHIYAAGRRKIFVTAALGALDPVNRVMEYARAGHNPIVWRSPSRGFTRLLQPRGIGLGVGPVAIFNRTLEVERMEMEPGDTVVFYSDGVTEAMNQEFEQFGEQRLMASIDGAGDIPAEGVRERILTDLSAFLQGNSPQDDATIVVLRAVSPAPHSPEAATLIENPALPGDGKLG